MINFANLLTKRFAKIAVSDYPDQEAYPNLPPDIEGNFQPVLIGNVDNSGATVMEQFLNAAPTVLVDLGVDQTGGIWRARKFKICAKIKNPETTTTHGLSATGLVVFRYQDQVVTTLTSGFHYTLSDSNTQINMINGASGDLKEDAQIRVQGITYQDDAVGTFTGTPNALIRFIPDIIHFLIKCFTPTPTTQIDLASLTIVGNSKSGIPGTFTNPSWQSGGLAIMRGYFDKQVTVKEVIDALAFSADCTLMFIDGKYTLRRYADPTTPTDAFLVDAQIHDWIETLRLDSIFNNIVVNYFQFPAGVQTLEFDITKRKRKKKRQKVTLETQAFKVARNTFTRSIGGVSVRDNLGEVLDVLNEFEITSYFQSVGPAQNFADELYRRWRRPTWQAKFEDVDGGLLESLVTNRVIIYRNRSANGDISSGKVYRLIDAIKNHSQKTTTVNRIDEVKK